MIRLYWDASGLVKRYCPEPGSDTVDALFRLVTLEQMVVSLVICLEIYHILIRKRNDGRIDPAAFAESVSSLREGILYNPDVSLLSIDDADLFDSFDIIAAYNVNSSDAAVLAAYLREIARTEGSSPLLIASDRRLLRAAAAHGIRTLNPEDVSADQVPALLASIPP